MQQFLVKKETPDKREGMVILDTSVRGFGAFVIQKVCQFIFKKCAEIV